MARLRGDPACAAFHAELERYVARYGDRCLEELKLETVTLREDPAFLLHMIRSYAERGTVEAEAQSAREAAIRRDAEARMRARLGGGRRWLFERVMRSARARVRDRENLRFERTRVFGLVRRLFLELGARFAERGLLSRPREVFWLTVDEVFEAAGGRLAPETVSSLVAERRTQFEQWEHAPAPPERFETREPPPLVFGAEAADPADAPARAGAALSELKGTGCCPGVVRERVRVVRDPREARDVTGRILVAERTDPGWTLLFPAVRGLLVQRGSLLSHSAIVAREMGLPCVVGIPGLLDTLQDGEEVEMDGTTGRVIRLERT
jgi:pyruvate,water dikinase